MAARYWVGGAATWDGTAGAKWSTTSGGASGAAAPTAADDVYFDAASGAVAVALASGAVARSLDCTGFTGTLSHGSGFTLTVGDATAGAGNVALKFVAGMTYTLGNVATSAITFASTSATQQTIDFGGKTFGNVTFSVAGNYALISGITQDKTATVTFTAGTVAMDGVSNNAALTHTVGALSTGSTTKTLNFGSSTIITLKDTSATTINLSGSNTTLSASLATFQLEAASASTRIVRSCTWPNNTTVYRIICNGTGEFSPGPITVVDRLERNGNGYAFDQINLTFNNTLKINPGGTLKLNPSPGFRMTIWPNSTAIQANLDITGATLDAHDIDFQDVGFITGGANLDLSAMAGGSGDCGGNVMVGGGTLTFTPATTQTWNQPAGGEWSNPAHWTSRVPLVQDDVVMTNAFTGSPTIDVNRKWFCRNITFAGGSGAVTLRSNNYECYFTGNVTLRSSVSLTNAASTSYLISPRFPANFTFGGAGTQAAALNFQSGNGGSMTFVDNGIFSSAMLHRAGIVTIAAGVTVGFDSYQMNANQTASKAVMRLAGTLQIRAGSGTVLVLNQAATFNEFTDLGGALQFTSTSASAKTLTGNGASFPKTIFPSGTGGVTIQGSNSFSGWDAPAGGKITLTSGTTQTLRGAGLDKMTNGTNIVTLVSSTPASAATMTKANGMLAFDYLSIQDITETGSAPFYAGTNSTNVSGNTGILFTAAPAYLPQALAA